MASSITTPPPGIAYNGDPIWVTIQSDLVPVPPVYAYFELQLTAGGPTVGQTLTLNWPGGTITYTAAVALTPNGLTFPTQLGGQALATYADRVAEALRLREDFNEVFHVSRQPAQGSAEIIHLTHTVSEVFALTYTENMDNLTVVADSVSTPPIPASLRALLKVLAHTGNTNTDYELASLHAPYNATTGQCQLDVSAAFAALTPVLPSGSTIPHSANWGYGTASGMVQRYYLRHADKYGVPPTAEALLRTTLVYTALLGSRSFDNIDEDFPYLQLHTYRRADGATFVKPVDTQQPDWVYIYSVDDTPLYPRVQVFWSDGSTSVHFPYGQDGVDVSDNQVYYFASGYAQLDLGSITPGAGVDPEAYIEAYQFDIAPQADGQYVASVRYGLDPACSPWNLYLLISNGVGGMETVRLHGKTEQQFTATADVYEQYRPANAPAYQPDFRPFQATGRRKWQVNTGWYTDPYYLRHLRQLPLAECWIVDVPNMRYLPVLITAKDLITNRDDETLFSLEFELTAAWKDRAINL